MRFNFLQGVHGCLRSCSYALGVPGHLPRFLALLGFAVFSVAGRGSLFAAPDGWVYSQQFLFSTNSGWPSALIAGSDGRFYGVTGPWQGTNRATIFRVNPDGTGLTVLWLVPTNSVESAGPLMEASDGVLYGTAEYGGTNGDGSVFRLERDGSGFGIVHHFQSGGGNAYYPKAALVEGPDGALYGTTRSGGSAGYSGTAYKLNKDGSGFAVLHSFGSVSGDGANPRTPLVPGSDGLLYGLTPYDGTNNGGTVFRMDRTGGGYEVLHHFAAKTGDGRIPDSLLEGTDGVLYGSTAFGGTSNCGAIFRLNRDGTAYAAIWNFTNCSPGNFPYVQVMEGRDGWLYGTTGQCGAGYGTVFQLSKDGSAYAELWRFRVAPGDGQWPVTAPIQASDSGLYGFTHGLARGAIYRFGPAQHLVNGWWEGERFRLRFGGMPGQQCELQRTSDLSNWTTISSFAAPLFPFLDHTETNSPEGRAFYRSHTVVP